MISFRVISDATIFPGCPFRVPCILALFVSVWFFPGIEFILLFISRLAAFGSILLLVLFFLLLIYFASLSPNDLSASTAEIFALLILLAKNRMVAILLVHIVIFGLFHYHLEVSANYITHSGPIWYFKLIMRPVRGTFDAFFREIIYISEVVAHVVKHFLPRSYSSNIKVDW